MSNRVDEKLDKIVDTLGQQAVTLGRLTVSVEEHVKRSNRLEEIVLPIQRKINYVEGSLKFIGLIGLLSGIIEVIILCIRH